MCLILLSYEQHPRYRLVFAANRDEFHDRPTAPMAFWEDEPDLLAGRDLEAGGTWFGVTRSGRLAAVTNYREPGRHREEARSRGELVTSFLRGDQPPEAFLNELARAAHLYNGFNLLVGDRDDLAYFSNRDARARVLGPGVYGLSNHLLDTPWPKVVRGKEVLERVLGEGAADPERLLDLLDDRTCPPDDSLPNTGVSREWERALASMFIATPGYGTRSSTVLLLDHDGQATVVERSYDVEGLPSTRRFELDTHSS